MEPFILHIETSSRTCSAALSSGAHPVASLQSEIVNDHSAALAPMIRKLLISQQINSVDLSAVSISIGPGSYTGLRVGLSTAKALCYAIGCRLITVDTLQSLAMTSLVKTGHCEAIYVPVLDARRQDAYIAVFDKNGTRLQEDQFITVNEYCLADIHVPGEGVVICGEGTSKWVMFEGREDFQVLPLECHALNLVESAWQAFQAEDFADLSACVPKYLKPPNITSPR